MSVGVSLLVFNGLLYGGDMAPRLTGAVDDFYRLPAKVTHEEMWSGPGAAYIEALIRSRREAYRAEQRAEASTKETAGGTPLIPSIWQQQLLAQLSASPLTQVILNQPRQQ